MGIRGCAMNRWGGFGFVVTLNVAIVLACSPMAAIAAETPQVVPIPAGSEAKAVSFARIVSGIKAGQFVGTYTDIPVCFPASERVYSNDRVVDLSNSSFPGTFEEKAKSGG